MELSPFWSFWFQGIPLLPPLVPHQSPVAPVTNSLPSSQADFQRLPNLALGPSDRPVCRTDLYQSLCFKVEPYDLYIYMYTLCICIHYIYIILYTLHISLLLSLSLLSWLLLSLIIIIIIIIIYIYTHDICHDIGEYGRNIP